jgi:hypothetical protein
MRLLRIMLVMFALFPLSACGLSNGPIEGQVFEAGTHKPIAGTIVIVRWHGTYSIPFADTRSSCYHVETATTDAQGHFKTPAWTEKSKGFLFSGDYWVINMYKSGYQEYWPPSFINSDEYHKNVRFMEPFKGTREERFEKLQKIAQSSNCNSASNSGQNLYPYYEALYLEAKSLAMSADEHKKLQWFREVAASYAVTGKGDMTTQRELDEQVELFLEDHLK